MSELHVDGYCLVPNVVSISEVNQVIFKLEANQEIAGGIRNILGSEATREVLRASRVWDLAEAALSSAAKCVRGILFDKNPEANWNLPFHQDTKIAVAEYYDMPSYGQFSVKDGVPHVCPPGAVLERQIALRIHLDDCSEETGPVRVIPKTHKLGIMSQSQVDEALVGRESVSCAGQAGSVLIFHSLLLHGSNRSTSVARRRVLHLEFCDADMPSPLKWRWHIGRHD